MSFTRRDERIETRERDRTKGYNPGTNQLYVVFHTSCFCVPLPIYTSIPCRALSLSLSLSVSLYLCFSLSLSSPSPSPLETFRSTHPSTSTPPFHLLSTSLFPLGYYSFTWVRLYNVHGAHVCSRDVRAVAPSFTRGLTSRGNSG